MHQICDWIINDYKLGSKSIILNIDAVLGGIPGCYFAKMILQFWQKDSLITHNFLNYAYVLWYLAKSQIWSITLYVCLFTILNIDAVLGCIQKGKLTFTRCNRKVNNNKISKCPAEVPIRHNQHALDSDRCNMLLSFLLLTISSSQLPGIKYRIQIQILQLVLDYTDISNQSLRGLEIKNIVLIL